MFQSNTSLVPQPHCDPTPALFCPVFSLRVRSLPVLNTDRPTRHSAHFPIRTGCSKSAHVCLADCHVMYEPILFQVLPLLPFVLKFLSVHDAQSPVSAVLRVIAPLLLNQTVFGMARLPCFTLFLVWQESASPSIAITITRYVSPVSSTPRSTQLRKSLSLQPPLSSVSSVPPS
jgi:hypothetical protein